MPQVGCRWTRPVREASCCQLLVRVESRLAHTVASNNPIAANTKNRIRRTPRAWKLLYSRDPRRR